MVTASNDPTPLHPEVLWAQRPDLVYVTVNIWDMQHQQLELTEDKLRIQAESGKDGKVYAVEMEFYEKIDKENSKFVNTGRNVSFVLKKEKEGPYWPRLLKTGGKSPHWLKTDFAKWKDEDELDEPEADPFGMGGMEGMGGFPGMGGMGGMPGMGGMGGMPGMGGMGMPGMPGMEGMGGMDFSQFANMNNFMMGGGAGDSDDDESPEGENAANEAAPPVTVDETAL